MLFPFKEEKIIIKEKKKDIAIILMQYGYR